MHTTRHGRRGPRPDRHPHRHPPFGGPEFDEPGFGPGGHRGPRGGFGPAASVPGSALASAPASGRSADAGGAARGAATSGRPCWRCCSSGPCTATS